MVAWSIFKAMAPLGGRPNTQLGDHVTPNAHSRWFVLFYHVWGPAWIKIHWNSIWLRVRSHMTSRCYTWGFGTTLHDFGGVFGRPLYTLFWTLTISWSWLLAHMWSGLAPSLVLSHTKLLEVHQTLWHIGSCYLPLIICAKKKLSLNITQPMICVQLPWHCIKYGWGKFRHLES